MFTRRWALSFKCILIIYTYARKMSRGDLAGAAPEPQSGSWSQQRAVPEGGMARSLQSENRVLKIKKPETFEQRKQQRFWGQFLVRELGRRPCKRIANC